MSYYTEYDTGDRTLINILGTALIRPFRLLFTQPIIQAIARKLTPTLSLSTSSDRNS
jgi:hypothetical protein